MKIAVKMQIIINSTLKKTPFNVIIHSVHELKVLSLTGNGEALTESNLQLSAGEILAFARMTDDTVG